MSANLSTSEAAHEAAVKEMFSGIAGRYDLLNHILSLNIDKRWRRRVRNELSQILERPDAVVLDVACGTGDLSIELGRETKATVIGTDFCRPMLAVARDKNAAPIKIPYVEADAMELSFGDNSFDAVTIAFGLRNLPNFENGLHELNRVLKPGGTLAILECSHPPLPGFRQLYHFYFGKVLPMIGGLVSGSPSAYKYLPDSVSKFPKQKDLSLLLEKTGFTSVSYQNLTGGIAALHTGRKNDINS